jgi:hypothetical protein
MAKASKWKKTYLKQLRKCGNITQSAKAANISRMAVYKAKKASTVFAREWEDALEEAVDSLEQEAWKRAKDSSDKLLQFLLKAHRPDKYKDSHKHEISGKAGIELVIDWDNGQDNND